MSINQRRAIMHYFRSHTRAAKQCRPFRSISIWLAADTFYSALGAYYYLPVSRTSFTSTSSTADRPIISRRRLCFLFLAAFLFSLAALGSSRPTLGECVGEGEVLLIRLSCRQCSESLPGCCCSRRTISGSVTSPLINGAIWISAAACELIRSRRRLTARLPT